MLREIGLENVEQLHRDVPDELRLGRPLNIPPRFESEQELYRHVSGLLDKNTDCNEIVSFLGGGCYQHYVPAICDEINSRSEFRTAYAGEPYDDHGRFQALFEYQSLMAELLDTDVVNVPSIDGAQSAATSIRMAQRITGRDHALISEDIDPDKFKVILNYCTPAMIIDTFAVDRNTGHIDLAGLEKALSDKTAAVYLEYPSYLGVLPIALPEVAKMAHASGSEFVVGLDPCLLGVLESPANLGADILCGDIQPLGMHMHYGGGHGGFIATRDDLRYINEYPSRLFGITNTIMDGEYGFGDVAYDRTSFADRENSKEYVGTQAALWGITAGVYLALLGPDGIKTLGERIVTSSRYLAKKLNDIDGICVKYPDFAKELVVDFNAAGKTVAQINDSLYQKGFFGGIDLSTKVPQLGQCALYCCTEVISKSDIDRLAEVLKQEVEK